MFREFDNKATPEQRPHLRRTAVAHCVFDVLKPPSYAYVMLTPPSHDRGVCHFSREDITQSFSADGKYLGVHGRADIRPPQSMTLSNGPCPGWNDASYIDTDDISPGMFASLMQFWQTIMTSQADLETASGELAPKDRRGLGYEMLEAIARDFPKHPEVPWAIGMSINRNELDRPYGDTLAYDICVASFCVQVDLTGQGWRIVHIETFGQPPPPDMARPAK